ncbi:MAG: prenyltransferase/squalene oxidase repeat-containing protein [Dehalococcoidia bacterium]
MTRWWSAGWGYNRWIPSDSDSTVWALKLAEAMERRRSIRVFRAQRFLIQNMRRDGGLATFAVSKPIQRITRMRSIRFTGWCSAHTCVTAAAAGLSRFPKRAQLLDYLQEKQLQDGGWLGYWWYDREYTTALAAEALGTDNRPELSEEVRRAVIWACDRVSPNGSVTSEIESSGSAFATALNLRTLALSQDPQAVYEPLQLSLEWLLRHQQRDGSWSPSARLRVPPPDSTEPEHFQNWQIHNNARGADAIGAIVLDRRGVFTTATVLASLNKVRSVLDCHGNR